MSVATGLGLAVTAVGLWIVAVDARAPRPWRLLGRPWWPAFARLLGLLAAVGACRAFVVPYGAVSGALVGASAVTAAASLVIVGLPTMPRATWLLLAVAPIVAAVAIALGGLHG